MTRHPGRRAILDSQKSRSHLGVISEDRRGHPQRPSTRRHRPNTTTRRTAQPRPREARPAGGIFFFLKRRHRPLAAADQAKRKGKAKPRRTATNSKKGEPPTRLSQKKGKSQCTADKCQNIFTHRQAPTSRPANQQRRGILERHPPLRNAPQPITKFFSSPGAVSVFFFVPLPRWPFKRPEWLAGTVTTVTFMTAPPRWHRREGMSGGQNSINSGVRGMRVAGWAGNSLTLILPMAPPRWHRQSYGVTAEA